MWSRCLGSLLGQPKHAELGLDSAGIISPLLLVGLIVLITDDVGFFEAALLQARRLIQVSAGTAGGSTAYTG